MDYCVHFSHIAMSLLPGAPLGTTESSVVIPTSMAVTLKETPVDVQVGTPASMISSKYLTYTIHLNIGYYRALRVNFLPYEYLVVNSMRTNWLN